MFRNSSQGNVHTKVIKESAVNRNDSGSGTLCIWKSVSQPLITTTAKWVSSCCVAQNCVLDHVLRLTHTLVST